LTRVDDDQQPAPLDVDTLPLHDALPILYESRDDVRNLVRVLEVRREALSKEEDSDSKRLELLRRIAELKNDRMRDDEGALVAFLELVPLDPEYVEGRKELLGISERLGASVRVADALELAAGNAETLALKDRKSTRLNSS